MKLRETILFVHRWIGLTAGILFCIASFTGAALVFGNELDALVNRGAYPVTPGDAGIDAALAAARAAVPHAMPRQVRIPEPGWPVYRVDFVNAGTRQTLLIDPGSARVIEPTRPRFPLYGGLVRLHASLLAGPPGRWLVIAASSLAAVGMVAGAVLWWPGLRSLARGFRVRTKRSFYALDFDLHQVAGILALPVLFIITITGVLISNQAWSDRLVSVLHLDRPYTLGTTWPALEVPPPRPGTALPPPSALFQRAATAADGLQPRAIVYPQNAEEPIEVVMYFPPRVVGSPAVQVNLDHAGNVLAVRDPRALPSRMYWARHQVPRLHRTSFIGMPARLLYFGVCIVGGLLVPTGFYIWWYRRSHAAAVESTEKPAATAGSTR
jgi:uncharacterized iron-regulated membrane protein